MSLKPGTQNNFELYRFKVEAFFATQCSNVLTPSLYI